MGRFTRTRRARLDLMEIWEYVAADDPEAADRLLDRIDATCARIASFPSLGRSRDDLRPGLRYVPLGHYLILYRASESGVVIVRVLHARRDLAGLV